MRGDITSIIAYQNKLFLFTLPLSLSYTLSTATTKMPADNARFGTLAVHAGSPHDPTTGAVIAPVSRFLVITCLVTPTANQIALDFPVNHLCAEQRWQSCWYLRVYSQLES